MLILGFLFYLFTSKPHFFFGNEKHKTEIENIKNHHQRNFSLNKNALENINSVNNIEDVDVSKVYTSASQMPRYKSCAYYEEIKAQICTQAHISKYMEEFILPENGSFQELVIDCDISFVVDEFGYIGNVRTYGLENSPIKNLIIEHIKKMPKFAKPAYHNDIAVKVEYKIPFNLN